MATLSDEMMESYMYSSYNPYAYRYLNPKGKGGTWKQRSYFPTYGDDYFDNYQRAQLKAILSQVNPNLTPRLRKANTKDVGVQVNPRQDASVQCSLGPRTLLRRRRGTFKRPEELEQEIGSPVASPLKTVRFPRTLAVYSPLAARSLTTFPEEEEDDEEEEEEDEEELEETKKNRGSEKESVQPEKQRKEAETRVEKKEPEPEEQKVEPERKTQAQGLKERETPHFPEMGVEREKQQPAATQDSRPRFQFLEQKYGYYHCKDCNLRWESAYVWCVQGTSKVYFRQFCRTCQKSYNPYRVEDIICQSCKQTRCVCPVKLRHRHVDPKRPHRQDLCGRCKGKRLSCDSTFSFKYII
ncbi:zygote arrest protein 1 [Microcaecilia unicolor]|uniref:Zygote arrest protein 1 n=1 Tax=Microcaecilia unicolor TaxID=1415580 RepID=A0A6P7X450_9AMPH|nr:zygote arrest protein 1 [Microcaecilia unicolor]